ncbi:hypothetical protein MKX01_006999 [Papaver californicum]|nr:hypothetical protein MKX01_006999 [Papaver californicum]
MYHGRISLMDLKVVEDNSPEQSILHDLWQLDEVDPTKAKFPCCLVWNPLHIVSWIAYFIGHCCFPPNLSGHTCKHGYRHSENETTITWDDALRSCMIHFEHKSYNLFTCNCHSYIANCLNRLSYGED